MSKGKSLDKASEEVNEYDNFVQLTKKLLSVGKIETEKPKGKKRVKKKAKKIEKES